MEGGRREDGRESVRSFGRGGTGGTAATTVEGAKGLALHTSDPRC